ncbi:MAG: thiol-disulfide oxidoreductase DCC family protein [Candidatus Hydrogenedens sp.]
MKPIVVYDDTCEMCRNIVNYIKKKSNSVNNELEFLPISEIENNFDIVEADKQQFKKSVHLINNEQTLSKFEAIQEICQRVNIFPSLYRIKSPLLIFILNSLYKFIARYRNNCLFRYLSRLFFLCHY